VIGVPARSKISLFLFLCPRKPHYPAKPEVPPADGLLLFEGPEQVVMAKKVDKTRSHHENP